MDPTTIALLATGLSLGQAPAETAADIRFVNKRTLSIPVQSNPARVKELKEVGLFISRDRGGMYESHQTIKPLDTSFTLNAKEDGEYWVQVQEVLTNGTRVPENPREIPPAEKLVIDTTVPKVSFTAADFTDGEVRLEWKIDDKHPADATTKVFYMPSGADPKEAKVWREAPPGSIRKRTARFKPEFAGPIIVQVATADLAGNVGAENRELGGKPAISNSLPKDNGPLPLPKDNPFAGIPNPVDAIVPKSPLPVSPPVAPPPLAAAPLVDSSKPIAMGSGLATQPSVQPAAATTPEPANVQYSRSARFDLAYTLDGGPSGVARTDLYVTRDDGRSWVRWSAHDGRETPLKIVLDQRFNKEVEGDYGFALVPVSGAGLSDGAPTAGATPELKVRVDLTAPIIKVYQPTADPANKNALVLNWEAADRNFGKECIAIEYAEDPRGTWKSVSGDAAKLENTGTYSWQPPLTLATPKVYLRFTAWDLAGNKSEVVTPNPILVDLQKPKARIQGIAPSIGR